MSNFERPKTAIRDSLVQMDPQSKAKWLGERETKLLELRQAESKTFNMQREMKHRVKIHANEVAQLKF